MSTLASIIVVAGFLIGTSRMIQLSGNEQAPFQSTTPPTAKIIVHEDVDIKDAPYLVSVQKQIGEAWQHGCAGSIIARRAIATSAQCVKHCVTDDFYEYWCVSVNPTQLQIRAGSSDVNNGGQVQSVAHLWYHEKFYDFYKDITEYDYDLAVLYLAAPLDLDATVKVIPVVKSPPVPGDILYITGWWRGNETAQSRRLRLHSIESETMNKRFCEEWIPTIPVTPRMVCTFDSGDKQCTGDVGAPAVLKDNGTLYLAGITSWGADMCRHFPPILVDIANEELKYGMEKYIKRITKRLVVRLSLGLEDFYDTDDSYIKIHRGDMKYNI